ncbi:GNAT family N-acetyltransferase [Pseudoroseicyclus sp. CXY001]|uniref:GNAT family N-acetyltransferase n=1 Tax=Pseudoroseicyclus sp. CXY001 TaxID=3242492 RepID=UPI0035709776
MIDTVIDTGRLTLRPEAEEDRAAFRALVSDREVIEYCAVWPHPPVEEVVTARFLSLDPARGWRLSILEGGRYLGRVTLVDGSLGLMIAREHWGRGVAREAATALIAHAFRTRPGLEAIEAGHFEANVASAWLLAGLGFRETARVTRPSRLHGHDLPGVELVLTRADWQASHG